MASSLCRTLRSCGEPTKAPNDARIRMGNGSTECGNRRLFHVEQSVFGSEPLSFSPLSFRSISLVIPQRSGGICFSLRGAGSRFHPTHGTVARAEITGNGDIRLFHVEQFSFLMPVVALLTCSQGWEGSFLSKSSQARQALQWSA